MNNILKRKIDGLENEIKAFSFQLHDFKLDNNNIQQLSDMIKLEMIHLNFDEIKTDDIGNIIGIIKGYKEGGESLVLISNIDLPITDNDDELDEDYDKFENDKAGILTSLYSGALIKRALAMLNGDLIITCNFRKSCCSFGVKHLFKHTLKDKAIKGVILCEPTNFNINIGNKGRLEYEIIVRNSLSKKKLINKKESIVKKEVALLNFLNAYTDALPTDSELGKSSLQVKNVKYENYACKKHQMEMHIQVDRFYIPSENRLAILNQAKKITKEIYYEDENEIDSKIIDYDVQTLSGNIVKDISEYLPWKMEGYHEFVTKSLEVLKETKFDSSIKYWKNIITEGSYIHGVLKIPTIGFGAGKYESTKKVSLSELKTSIYGKCLIIYRQIGIPTFGWSDDEI